MQQTVIDINKEAYQRFDALFGSFEASLNGQKSNPFHQIRQSAFEKLNTLQFPTLRHEDWKYTSVQRILKHKYVLEDTSMTISSLPEVAKMPDVDAIRLVFVNGVYQSHLSDNLNQVEGLSAFSVEDAMNHEVYNKVLSSRLTSEVDENTNPFFQLNTAFSRSGMFINVDKNVVIEKPIQIVHISQSGDSPKLSAPLFVFNVEQSAVLNVVESYISTETNSENPVLNTSHCFYNLAKQAKCNTYKLQKLSDDHYLIHDIKADQDRDSVFTSFTADLGGAIIRNNINAIHGDENILTNLYGVLLGLGTQHVDNQTLIDHAKPHCQSNEWYKCILDDRARGVFNGKVMVRQDAQKINAFQQNNALILSDTARMDAKPQLEIFADDVRCSHGATIGQIDEDAVFYLRSRGLSRRDAMLMLQLAFLQEVTDFIEHNGIRDFMVNNIVSSFEKIV